MSFIRRLDSPIERVFVLFQWLVMGYVIVAELLLRPVIAAALLVLALAHLTLYALILRRHGDRIALSLGDILVATGIYYLSGHLNGPAYPLVYFVIGAAAFRFRLPVALAVTGLSWVLFQVIPMAINYITLTAMNLSHAALLYLAATFMTSYVARMETEHARLHEQARSQVRDLNAVYETSLAIAAQLELRQVLCALAQRAADLFSVKSSGIYMLDAQRQELELMVGYGLKGEYAGLRLKMGEGLVGRVAASGQPMTIADWRHWEGRPAALVAEGHTAAAGVPLEWQGQVIGVLVIADDTEGRRFTQEDIRRLTLLAPQAAVAIMNARHYEQARERLIQVEALQQVTQAIHSSLNLREILTQVVTQLHSSFGYPHVGLYLLQGDKLRCEAYVGFDPVPGGARHAVPLLPVTQGVIGRVARTGQAALVRDVAQDPDFIRSREDITMEIAVPLVRVTEGAPGETADGHVLGVLNVESGPERPLTEKDLELLLTFAQQVSIAVDHARLYQQVQDQLRDLSAVRETLLDITAQLDPSETLQAITERARALVSAQGSAIYLLDAGRNELELATSTGLSRDYRGMRLALGEGLAGRVAASGQPIIVDNYQGWEGRAKAYAGEPFTAVAGVPLEWQGQVIGVLNVIDDIQRRGFTQADVHRLMLLAPQAAIAITNARLFEQLRQSAEDLERKVEARTRELAEANARLREADRVKMQFLANMSHELRTPMNSIIGYSELMLEETYGELTARQRDRLHTILRNARNLLDLINDLLDISRIEMGKVRLIRHNVNLNRVVETTLKTMEPMARQKGLWLQVVMDETLPPVQADEARLVQILNNLLSNAIKFTRQGGVTVTVYPYSDAGDWAAVSVSDTGIGIAPEHIPLIFEEFRQIDQSATREFGGTGLGLAIVRRLVELHGGRIWVESTPGQGSTFTFVLPTVRRSRGAGLSLEAVRTLAETLEPGKRLVLIIDDDPAIEELIRAYLEGQDDYQMLTVQDGEQGLALAQELQPQAILLDVLMAGKDGWEVLEELKGDARTTAIPVIVMSVMDEREMGLRLGAVDYLVKPVGREEVLASLARVSVHSLSASELIADA